MKEDPGIFVLFLLTSAFLLLLLITVMFLPRLLRKKEPEFKDLETNTVMGAFHALGNEIKSLKEQLIMKERLAALGEVSAGIAHELRNPMGVIAGYARLLLKGLDPADRRREAVQGILNEVEEMNSVMEELLKFSNSEALNKTDVDLSNAIMDVLKGIGDKGKAIAFSPQGPFIVRGDETLLKQAVKNLLHNAFDAGDKVWVSIERGLSFDKAGTFIVVKDNGKGIPEDDLNRIFMPFYTTKNSGSGIGLALVQKIAMGHGGNITVESMEGKGSTFRLFLPVE